MIIKQGELISQLEKGLYGLRLTKHRGTLVGPLVSEGDVEQTARARGYYDDQGAREDMEIEGPFQYLHLIRTN